MSGGRSIHPETVPARPHGSNPVYFDNNSTTPLDPRVLEVMQRWLRDGFGNASSVDHQWGWDASDAVEHARAQVAVAMGADSAAFVTFVSGATEGLNMVLRSCVGPGKRSRLVTCATEHDAVLASSRCLRDRGVQLDVLAVDRRGHIDLELLKTVLATGPSALVVLMLANNEIGTIHPVGEIARVVHAAGGWLLSDATQALGKCAVDFAGANLDFAVVSAHKVYGPQGVGAVVTAGPLGQGALEPLIVGGGQERGRRGGTLNTAGIAGLGEACRVLDTQLAEDMARMGRLRDRLERSVLSEVPDCWVNGDAEQRLCNTSNIGFKGVDARTLIRDMHDVAVATRSACSSGSSGPSHVLKAIGLSDEDAYSCIRFSLGRFTTEDEIDYAIAKVTASVHKLRRLKSVRA